MKQLTLMLLMLSSLHAEIIRDDSTKIVHDTFTRLQWQDNTTASGLNWEQAIRYCDELTLGGYRDWRLPNINELNSIVETGKSPSIKNGFKSTKLNTYWSSSTSIYGTEDTWTVYFVTGSNNYNSKTYDFTHFSVRCVRGGE